VNKSNKSLCVHGNFTFQTAKYYTTSMFLLFVNYEMRAHLIIHCYALFKTFGEIHTARYWNIRLAWRNNWVAINFKWLTSIQQILLNKNLSVTANARYDAKLKENKLRIQDVTQVTCGKENTQLLNNRQLIQTRNTRTPFPYYQLLKKHFLPML
jgi:hypothetical protein